MAHQQRQTLFKRLARQRSSEVICYVTGDRAGLQTMIAEDAVTLIGELLDGIGECRKISLLLYTRGGNTLAAWSLVRLIREHCEDFEVIVPSLCHSGGTLICLGANRIIMTNRAQLGPIDPSISTPLNPTITGPDGSPSKIPISVEDVAGFIELARKEANLDQPELLAQIFMKLADHVHPLALGKVQRSRDQIQSLARKLLSVHMKDDARIDNIIRILCSEAGSHDYVIYRTEARESLGLKVNSPGVRLKSVIEQAYGDIRSELELGQPYNPNVILGPEPARDYEFTRCVCETVAAGYRFLRRGRLERQPNGQISDAVEFEGWEKNP